MEIERVELKGGRRCLQFFQNYWKTMVIFITPMAALPIFLLDNTPSHRCMYVVLVMAIFWISAAIPLPVTALFPIAAFPIMGILSSNATCRSYFQPTIIMLLAGTFMGIAIEYSMLHKRIALRTVLCVGCSFRKLFFGMFFISALTSMWISNSVTVSIMCPIIKAVLEELEKAELCKMYTEGKIEDIEKNIEKGVHAIQPTPTRITTCFFLGSAYAATIAGSSTLIGTGTNLTFKGIYEAIFDQSPIIDFPRFMLYAIPLALVQLVLVWIYLQAVYLGMFRPNSEDAKSAKVSKEGEVVAKKVIKKKYDELGRMTFHEIAVAVGFVTFITLLFSMSPSLFPGWAAVITDTKIHEATPSILVIILFFILPASLDFLRFCTKKPDVPSKESPGVLTWEVMSVKTPWGLMILLAGAFAIAEGSKVSGMSSEIVAFFVVLKNYQPMVILFATILILEVITNFTSNVATANVSLPILAEMSIAIGLHPLYLMLPATIASGMAFHLPVGTPPNAIISGVAYISTKDMLKAGIGPTIVTVITIWVFSVSWIYIVYPETKSYQGGIQINSTKLLQNC